MYAECMFSLKAKYNVMVLHVIKRIDLYMKRYYITQSSRTFNQSQMDTEEYTLHI